MIIPKLWFGTWYTDIELTETLCLYAFDLWYRHIDTAQWYKNEEWVWAAIKKTAVHRSDIFLTTKIRVDNYSYDWVINSFDDSLKKLKTDYVDQLMIHRPRTNELHHTIFDAFMLLKKQGKIKYLSVSNFPILELNDAISYTKNDILANQIEKHVYLDQTKLETHCRSKDIEIIAYAPLCRGDVFADEILKDIADKHNVGIASIALRRLIQMEWITTLTGWLHKEYLLENRMALEIQLDNEDIDLIQKLPKNIRNYGVDSEYSPNRDD